MNGTALTNTTLEVDVLLGENVSLMSILNGVLGVGTINFINWPLTTSLLMFRAFIRCIPESGEAYG